MVSNHSIESSKTISASMGGNNMLVAVRMRPLSNKEKKEGQKECCEVSYIIIYYILYIII